MTKRDRKERESKLSEEDRLLWKRVGETVTPLRGRRHQGSHPAQFIGPAEPDRSLHPARHSAPVQPASGPLARLDDRTTSRIRKGRAEIDSRIDLHGMTQQRAHSELRRFLLDASLKGDRIVLVITGKGREGPGILRRAVPLWLEEEPLRSIAGAWRPAGRAHGGEGALYVRLKRNRDAGNQ